MNHPDPSATNGARGDERGGGQIGGQGAEQFVDQKGDQGADRGDVRGDDGLARIVDAVLRRVERPWESSILPCATYRIQLNKGCSFRDAARWVRHLDTMGITDLYVSPFLAALPGSAHGYDVVNHGSLNPEIGTSDDLHALRDSLRARGMGMIADVVPNHMSATPQQNAWWHDVLENGQSSPFASYFDIDWMPLKPDLASKVLLPVLGDQFGKVLEDGLLVVRYGEGVFWLEYYDLRFPLAPRSYSVILSAGLDELTQRFGESDESTQELLSILTAIRNLPRRTETDPARLVERWREKEIIKRRLHELTQRSPALGDYVEEMVRRINGQRGVARSFDRLDELLGDQAYRLAYWRVAADEINYRRFFDVNELAAICTENPRVFAESHRLLFELIEDGTVTGLRIDHPDGLYDPLAYFRDLQEWRYLGLCRAAFDDWRRTAGPEACPRPSIAAPPDTVGDQDTRPVDRADAPPDEGGEHDSTWPVVASRLQSLWRTSAAIAGSPRARPLFVVVEKILAQGERISEDWPVHGTVGYDFLNAVNGLFVQPAGEKPLSALYQRFTEQTFDLDELCYQGKRLIVRMSMASELSVLGHQLDRVSEANRWTRDFTLNSLTRTLQEVITYFRVYRTYVQSGRVTERDRRIVEEAVERAKRANPAMDASLYDFVRDVLLLRFPENADERERAAIERFVGKFQQLTGPIMAKGIEDTVFYRYNRLASLNEVGGEPARFGIAPEEFHQFVQSRLPLHSHSFNATSTHDTKRSEDVRARINVLSELPRQWQTHVQRWSRWNRSLKREVDGQFAPSRNTEYLIYQTLVGTWPDEMPDETAREEYLTRLQRYVLKVVREAKVRTSWIRTNEPYEAAATQFVADMLAPGRRRAFVRDLHEFAQKVADHGRWNSLSQLLLKIGSPGVADFYQGTELWNLRLVDPDNRGPVDFATVASHRDRLMASMARALRLAADVDAANVAAANDDETNVADTAAAGTATAGALTADLDVVDAWLGDDPLLDSEEVAAAVGQLIAELLSERRDGRIKMFATLLGLRARRRSRHLFTHGRYLPLELRGTHAERLVAFARRQKNDWAVVLAPRFTVGVTGFGGAPPVGAAWGDTRVEWPEELVGRELRDVFTRQRFVPGAADRPADVAAILGQFPISLMIGSAS